MANTVSTIDDVVICDTGAWNMNDAQVRFVAAYFGVISRVTINGSVRELRRNAHVAPGEHWEITESGLWCCSRAWKRLVFYPFDEKE